MLLGDLDRRPEGGGHQLGDVGEVAVDRPQETPERPATSSRSALSRSTNSSWTASRTASVLRSPSGPAAVDVHGCAAPVVLGPEVVHPLTSAVAATG